MKNIVLRMVLCTALLLILVNTAAADPLFQETDEIDPGRAVIVFSEIFRAGLEAAAVQFSEGDVMPQGAGSGEAASEPIELPAENIPTEPAAEDTSGPLPPFSPLPAETEISLQNETGGEPEIDAAVQISSAPSDPEEHAVSFGMSVSELYDSIKASIKNQGRHTVSFEEKGRKGASKIVVDDDIDIFLYYTKEKQGNVVSRVGMEALINDEGQRQNTAVVTGALLEALCESFGIPCDEMQLSGTAALLAENGSAVLGDLLLYGNTEQKGGNTKLDVSIYYTGSGYDGSANNGYSQSAENDFRSLVAELMSKGIIPDSGGDFRYHADYRNEWAQINWYQWESFDQAKNLVISADISWNSASGTPNFADSGCGFVLRCTDTNNNLYAAMNMDGNVHFGGIKKGTWLGESAFAYGTHSTKGSAQLTVVLNGGTMMAYVDGALVGQQKNLAITDYGNLAFSLWSGTNKDYGTRCTFENVYYYVFE